MGTIKHDIVDDRVIEGDGTSVEEWAKSVTLNTMPDLDIQQIIPQHARVCIIAPHPDDEILGCAGLIQHLDQCGYQMVLIAVTNGTASHPNSLQYSQSNLNQIRPNETREALKQLHLRQNVERIALELTDGEIFKQQSMLMERLKAQLRPHDFLVTTFIHDGHPDHEITGQVTVQLAKDLKLPILQILIWAWHWAKPDDLRIPWHKALKLSLESLELKKKYQAIQCFKSQLQTDPTTQQAPILSQYVLQRMMQPWEVYIYD